MSKEMIISVLQFKDWFSISISDKGPTSVIIKTCFGLLISWFVDETPFYCQSYEFIED